MAEAVLTRRSIVKNEYELLYDNTITGSATNTVDITGLNLVKGEEYVLEAEIINAAGVSKGYTLYVNANYTNSNYYCQGLDVASATIAQGRENIPYAILNIASGRSSTRCHIKISDNGIFTWQSHVTNGVGGSSLAIREYYGSSTFTITNATSLRIYEATASIGIGSRFQLYKVGK